MPRKKGDTIMKKIIGIILVCLLACSCFAGCARASAEQQSLSEITPKPQNELGGDSVGLPNPIVNVESVDEINRMVGCNIKSVQNVYDGIAEEGFTVINGEPKIGEYRYTYQGIPVVIRAGITESDISGIYMTGSTTPDTYLTESNPYAVVDTGYGLWTRWFAGGMQYSIQVGTGQDPAYTEDGNTLEEVVFMFRDYQAYASLPWYMDEEIVDYPDDGTGRYEFMLRDREILRELNGSISGNFGTGNRIPFLSITEGNRPAYAHTVTVSTMDELLAAIAPDTEIILKAGEYRMTSASDYGKGVRPYYVWEDSWDGFQLKIRGVSNLCIRGEFEDSDGTVTLLSTLLAESRYAIVLQFSGCSNVRLEGLVVGHTDQGECTGAVVDFNECTGASVQGCELFGCGTFGITAEDTAGIDVKDTIIHSCSYGHVEMYRCRDVQFDKCSFLETFGYIGNLFSGCDTVRFTDCDFAFNSAGNLFMAEEGTDAVELKNCLIAYNNMEEGLFGGNTGKYRISGGAYVDYSMDAGQYAAIPVGDAKLEIYTAPIVTPEP